MSKRKKDKEKEKEKEKYAKILPKFLNIRDYEFSKIIGIGSQSVVRLGKTHQSNRFYAIKKVKKSEMIKLGLVDRLWHEIKTLSLSESPYVQKYQGYGMDDKYIYIITELVNGGNFYDLLRKKIKFPLPQAM